MQKIWRNNKWWKLRNKKDAIYYYMQWNTNIWDDTKWNTLSKLFHVFSFTGVTFLVENHVIKNKKTVVENHVIKNKRLNGREQTYTVLRCFCSLRQNFFQMFDAGIKIQLQFVLQNADNIASEPHDSASAALSSSTDTYTCLMTIFPGESGQASCLLGSWGDTGANFWKVVVFPIGITYWIQPFII